MLKYFCKSCNKTTSLPDCPFCGQRTQIESSIIYWCEDCNIPIYDEVCPLCQKKGKRIGSDIRPVFPAERLLIEIILGCPMKYRNASVWNTAGNYYFADGKKLPFTAGQTKDLNADHIRQQLEKYREQNKSTAFESIIEKFVAANKSHYDFLVYEATSYIRSCTENYDPTERYVSFSGGKDSTVVSSLVMRALSDEQILHIYGDTTLEFPETLEYVARFTGVQRPERQTNSQVGFAHPRGSQ